MATSLVLDDLNVFFVVLFYFGLEPDRSTSVNRGLNAEIFKRIRSGFDCLGFFCEEIFVFCMHTYLETKLF